MARRRRPWPALAAILALGLGACSDPATGPEPGPSRTFRMGFSGIPPRADLAQAIAAIDLWSLRADAAILSYELPWAELLAGASAESLVTADQAPLADYYRAKGHEITVYLDPANGLDRGGESDALVAAGRSITEPDIQLVFRRYAVVVDSLVQPAHLGLALETNLIRGLAAPEIYAAVRAVANAAAADVRARDAAVKLSVSVQVEWAWGRLGGDGTFAGIDADLVDFPFLDELGMSSYPYLGGFATPDALPLDYYARVLGDHDLPVLITEGGWTSAILPMQASSTQEQQQYIVRQRALLDEVAAAAVFQLTFTDLDVAADHPVWLFARLGLVDVDLGPKAALGAWDATFALPRVSASAPRSPR
ncbi:MAG TPA: hypothetical protein PLQ13_07655 [Candidatus Krumholzibacteria bacterium]|nr:hypothetical protein [Candidatus Krumholzibacteria bacterium]